MLFKITVIIYRVNLCICHADFYSGPDAIGNFSDFGTSAWNNRRSALEAFALIATFGLS